MCSSTVTIAKVPNHPPAPVRVKRMARDLGLAEGYDPRFLTPSGVAETGRRGGRETQEALARLHSGRSLNRSQPCAAEGGGSFAAPTGRALSLATSKTAMNYPASPLLTLKSLAARGDKDAAAEIKRRDRNLIALRRKLATHLERPRPHTERQATFRRRDERILRRKIAALERGLPVSAWTEVAR